MNKRIDVTKSFLPPFDEYVEQIKSIWENSCLTNMGEQHKEFENKLMDYLKIDNISLFVNGHMALELLIQSLGLEGEVITTPFTFASTTHAIMRNGLKPVFCDINDKNYTIDVNKIESLITEKTVAILPVHVYGQVCVVYKIKEIAKKHNLKVIYDGAHAFGTTRDGIGIGNFGDATMFSFHATKVFQSIEGGAVSFRDKRIGDELYKLKNFGIKSQVTVDGIGSNAKMNEFQAAMGLCNLRYIDKEIKKRKIAVEQYRKNLRNVKGIKLLEEQKNCQSNYAYFPILVDESIFKFSRDRISKNLEKENIYARKYFYPLISDYDCYKGVFYSENTPVAKYVSERILCLPLYADIRLEDIDYICRLVLNPFHLVRTNGLS